MVRSLTLFLAAVALVAPLAPARAVDSPAVGTWRMSFTVQTQRGDLAITFLMVFSDVDGKLVGDMLGTQPPLQIEPTIADAAIRDHHLKYTVRLGKEESFTFDGRVAENGKKIQGSFQLGERLMLVEMLPSQLKNLEDRFALQREALDTTEGGGEFFNALYPVLGEAAKKKLRPEEVRAYTDKASKFAEAYGPRWQRQTALQVATTLVDQEPFVAIALEQARQAERLLTPSDEIATHMQVLSTLARVMAKANKPDEAQALQARITKLEARDYQEYAKKHPPFKPDTFEGRKAKSDRAVLVELFTGAECPPCVAADLAFDALERTYKPGEVVLLQYHLHVPGPDPLTNKDAEARAESYGDKVRGTPAIFVNGKNLDIGGGGISQARVKYQAYREEIDEQIEKAASVKLQASASLKGNELTIKGAVSDLEKPGEKVTLRFALTEERVRYQGGNGLRYHHNVVRALPGGVKGLAWIPTGPC
jgi:hypothetical protein